jgi:hypothetical protein
VPGPCLSQTIDPQRFIFIPSTLDGYEQLKQELIKTQPIEVSPLNSIRVPPQYILNQHIKPGNALKRVIRAIGISFGVFIFFFLLLIVVMYFLLA